jgi:hypothetical protein
MCLVIFNGSGTTVKTDVLKHVQCVELARRDQGRRRKKIQEEAAQSETTGCMMGGLI